MAVFYEKYHSNLDFLDPLHTMPLPSFDRSTVVTIDRQAKFMMAKEPIA